MNPTGKHDLAAGQNSLPPRVKSYSRRRPQGSRSSKLLLNYCKSGSRVAELTKNEETAENVAAATATSRAAAAAAPSAALGQVNQPAQALAAVSILAVLSSATYQILSSASLPPLAEVLRTVPEALGLAAGCAGAAAITAKLLLGGKFHAELHRGRIYLQVGVPSHGPSVNAAACIITKPTGDARGNGAFATAVIPAGSHIADYSGQLLGRKDFFSKYPDGVGNFAMAIDQEWVIDAAGWVADTSTFHPVHINHSRVRPNVLRYYNRREGRVAFFAARDIQPGEELLYNYGRDYWRGREHLELP